MKYGGKGDIKPVEIKCRADIFENTIREFGAVFSCEWFGHDADSDFTKETIKTLCERSGINLLNDNTN